MTSSAVTELLAARRYLSSVLFHLNIDAEHMTARRLIELLEYFADHPTEYLELTHERWPTAWLWRARCRIAVPRSTGPRLTRVSYALSQPDTQHHVWLSH